MKIIDFIKEIGIPEFKSILGKIEVKGLLIYGKNIVSLVVILFLSLLALGIAEGSLNYLKIKMADPYVNFIDIPNGIDSKIISKKELDKELDSLNYTFDASTGKGFLDGEVIETREKNIRFKHNDNYQNHYGFILKKDNSFYRRIKSELVSEINTFHDDSWGIIVTESFLDDLKMDNSTPYITIESGDNEFPVPIAGIVKQLRRKDQFILSEKLYWLLTKRKGQIKEMLKDSNQTNIRYFIPGHETIPDTLRKLGFSEQEKFSKRSYSHVKGMIIESNDFENEISLSLLSDSSKLIKIKILQTQVLKLDTLIQNESIAPTEKKVKWNNKLVAIIQSKFSTKNYDQILDGFAENKKAESIAVLEEVKGVLKKDIKALIEAKITRIYNLDAIDLNLEGLEGKIKSQCYTVLFKSGKLDKVAEFEKYIKDRYDIELEKSTIEAKKNFSFFENLSKLLSISIIFLSFMSILFFTLNLLFSHINKNKRNLGTLKAFGLPNSNIIILYSVITLLLVSISFTVAYSLSSILGQSFLNFYTTFNNIDSANYISEVEFKNYDIKHLLGFMVVAPTVCILIGLFWKLYKITPGDLIYERK